MRDITLAQARDLVADMNASGISTSSRFGVVPDQEFPVCFVIGFWNERQQDVYPFVMDYMVADHNEYYIHVYDRHTHSQAATLEPITTFIKNWLTSKGFEYSTSS